MDGWMDSTMVFPPHKIIQPYQVYTHTHTHFMRNTPTFKSLFTKMHHKTQILSEYVL